MRIEPFHNKKEKKQQWRVRFQINRKEFYLTADTKKELNELVEEVRVQERREKRGLSEAAPAAVSVAAIFARHLPQIPKKHQRTLAARVFALLLELLPPEINASELKKAHFQKYIDHRRAQSARNRTAPVLSETIDKELYAVSSALKAAPLYFTELENYRKPEIPKAKARGKKRRRERLVGKESELDILLLELRKPKSGRQTAYTETHRRRLADDLEFRYETGLRRIESARLKFGQFYPHESALRDVVRWKTGTVTKFFPLSRRAVQLIEERRIIAPDAEYIFTGNGEAVESDYRTLRLVCKNLDIPYGRFTDGGFVPHDLRHNFASEIIQVTDIETAKSLTGHTGHDIFTYLHTNENLQRDAVRKREGVDKKSELVIVWKRIRRKKMRLKDFISLMR